VKYGVGIVPPRQMTIVDCVCSCQTRFSMVEMRTIFQNFNEIENHELQNSYLRGLIEVSRRENFANGGGRKNFSIQTEISRTYSQCVSALFSWNSWDTAVKAQKKGSQ